MSASFHSLKIAEVRRETPDAVSVRFEVPEELKPLFRFKPGQHLTLRALFDGEDVRRNYSVCSAPHEDQLRIAVKQVSGGVFSTWANANLTPGATIEVMPPHGSFTWRFGSELPRHYVAFAAGSGITPVLSLMKAALQADELSQFTLLYGNRSTDSIMFLEELAGLKDRYLDRLEIFHFLSREEEEIALFNGRLDHAKCDEILSTLVDPSKVDAFFICGPTEMMDAVESSLRDHGVPADRILLERFTAGRPSAAQAAVAAELEQRAAGRTMSVTLDGRRRQVAFDVATGNILDSVRNAGMPAPYACKAGVCATCRARVVAGTAEMKSCYGLTQEEVAAGYVLTCQAVPTSDDLVLDFDA